MHVVYTHCCGLGSGAKTAETICYIQYMVLGSLSSVYIKPESTGKGVKIAVSTNNYGLSHDFAFSPVG